MFSRDEMRALAILGPMYRQASQKKSEDAVENFFKHAYLIWNDHCPLIDQDFDADSERHMWLISQREKVRDYSTTPICQRFTLAIHYSISENHFAGHYGILNRKNVLIQRQNVDGQLAERRELLQLPTSTVEGHNTVCSLFLQCLPVV